MYNFDDFLPVKLLKLLPPDDLILFLGQVFFVRESLPDEQAMIPALVDKASSSLGSFSVWNDNITTGNIGHDTRV